MKRILIIDDDKKLNELLTDYLGKFNFSVRSCTHPHDGLSALARDMPDLVILDLMLPDMEGFEVCKRIREKYSVPVIMLTARGEVTDRVLGLELGADDYLPKPFEPRELVARIQAIFRRSPGLSRTERLRYADLTVDLKKRAVMLSGCPVELTSAEFDILKYFSANPNIVLTRDQILDNLRGIEWEAFNRSIDVLVSRLRQKLKDDPQRPSYIKTVWGTGYMFIAEPSEDA